MRYFELFESISEDELDEEQLDEYGNKMSRMSGGWVILPATMALYGKRAVTLDEAVAEWGTGSIYICTKEENGKNRVLFVFTSGQAPFSAVTSTHEAFHDQTGASKGFYTVMNVVHYQNGERTGSANQFGLNVKASLAVFK